MGTPSFHNSKSLPSFSSPSSSRPVGSLLSFLPIAPLVFLTSPFFTADVIAEAGLVYDVLLVSLVLSIFFLPLLRYRLELRERQRVYQRYINAARPPKQDDAPIKGSSSTRADSSWQLWSATDLEDNLELTGVSEVDAPL